MSKPNLETIVSLCKRRGFIYQGSEVYGGLSGTWDYGPLGVALKKNIMNLWWKTFVEDREDMYGVDAAILMNQKVWQASGHVDTFTDPLVECGVCHQRQRTDKILPEQYKEFAQQLNDELNQLEVDIKEDLDGTDVLLDYFNKFPQHEILAHTQEFIDSAKQKIELRKIVKNDVKDAVLYLGIAPGIYMIDNKLKCPNCGSLDWGESRSFNMMFKTNIGPVDDENSISYLRPETAQGIFTNFKNVVDSFSPDLPFGIAQQGKAFRNEISPRDFVFRSREFEQMEIEYFVDPENWEAEFEKWVSDIADFLDALGLPKDCIHNLEVEEADRAHYSKRTIDVEYDFPHGRDELLGLAYRTDFDLMNIQNNSGKKMEYRMKDGSKTFVPHVIEPSFGVERAIVAVLTSAYTEDEVNGETRTYLKLPEHLAPVRYAVSPLVKNKPELVAKAREVYEQLKAKYGNVMWDDNGNIGKRYRRQDEIGTPYCVVVDFQTLEDDTVTVRDRDTTEQKRVSQAELVG